MQISHLRHNDRAITCERCGHSFQVHASVLRDPHRLVEAKESIAAKHLCAAPRAPRLIQPEDVTRMVDSDLDQYWNDAITALFPAQSGAAR